MAAMKKVLSPISETKMTVILEAAADKYVVPSYSQ